MKRIFSQFLWTPEQVNVIKDRIDNGWLLNNTTGYPDDIQFLIDQKNAFDANPDIGEWDNFDLSNSASVIDAPIPLRGVTDEIHYAAIYAYLFNDSALAQKVADKLISYSNDPNLDIAARVAEFNYLTRTTRTSPWLFIAPRFVKFIESYSLVSRLANITQVQDDRLAVWFGDWNQVFLDILDGTADSIWGSQWQEGIYDLNSGFNLTTHFGATQRTNPPFEEEGGVQGYLTNQLQETGANNIRVEMAAAVDAYGVYFDSLEHRTIAFDFFKLWLRFAVFPDGTLAEINRGYAPDDNQLGIHYMTVAITAMAKAAITNLVAERNGHPSINDGDKWLTYTTSEGTDSFPTMSDYLGTPTSGGQKNLRLTLEALLKFHRQNGNQGWNPRRFLTGTSDLLDGGNFMIYRPIAAILNNYYNENSLESAWKSDVNDGYKLPLTGADGGLASGSYTEPTNGVHGVIYGLFYWADNPIIENTTVDFTGNSNLFFKGKPVGSDDLIKIRQKYFKGKRIDGIGLTDDVLSSVFSISEQGIFTASRKANVKSLIENDNFNPLGSPDDVQFLIDYKNAFDANPDIGEWLMDWSDGISANGLLPDSGTVISGSTDQIHYAAIYAYLFDDVALAEKVKNKLVSYAQDPQQDVIARAEENNFTFFAFKTTPWYFIQCKLVKMMDSYALIKDLAPVTTQEELDMFNWFDGYSEAFQEVLSVRSNIPLGSDWLNDNIDIADNFNVLVDDNEARLNPIYRDINGNGTSPTVTLAQETSLNAGGMGFAHYLSVFGTYFRNKVAFDKGNKMFELWLKLAVQPDGTDMNYYRASNVTPDNGVAYEGIMLSYATSAMMRQYVSGTNGNSFVENPSRLLDYSTSIGTDEMITNKIFAGTSTSGGNKSIKNVVLAHLKFLRQFGDQGWNPKRYYKDNSFLLDGSGSRPRMLHRGAVAALNSYYNEQELEDGWVMPVAQGYQGPSSHENGNGFTPRDGFSEEEPSNGHRNLMYGLLYWQEN